MGIFFGTFLCEMFLGILELLKKFLCGGDCDAAVVKGDRCLCEEEEGAVEVEKVVAD